MKLATHPRRGVLSQGFAACAMMLGIVASSFPNTAAAEPVDTEILLLVDIAASGLNKKEFSDVMEGYASAMTNSQVLDSIESGALGKVAVSMIFYGDDTVQTVGIPWMTIGSAAEAALFAEAARTVVRPQSGTSSLATAVDLAGVEFANNGYTSAAQVIEVAVATEPKGGNPGDLEAELQAARDSALADGVDVINAMALGKKASELESYYAANVIGGEVGGVVADTSSSEITAGLTGILTDHLTSGIGGGATASVGAVPEPKLAVTFLLLLSIQIFRSRARR